MLLNQQHLEPGTISTIFLYIPFCIFIFCLVNSFFSLMSADLVKEIDPAVIDTVKDLLYQDDFRNMSVSVCKGAWQEQGFLTAVEGSDESKLWKREGLRFKITVTDFPDLYRILRHILRGIARREAVLVFDTLAMNIFISIGCQANMERMGPYLHKSREKIIPGNLMLGYSPRIRREVRSYFDHSFQRIQESGWASHFFSHLGYKLDLGMSAHDGFEVFKCIEGRMRETERKIPNPFNLSFLAKPFIAGICLTGIASFVLLIEHFVSKLQHWLRVRRLVESQKTLRVRGLVKSQKTLRVRRLVKNQKIG